MQQNADPGAALAPSAMEALRLPAAFDATAHATAMDIDAVLSQDERQAAAFDAKVAAYRDAGLPHLLTFRGTQVFDPSRFAWPPFLHPQGRQLSRLLAVRCRTGRLPLCPRVDVARDCHSQQGIAAGWEPVQLCPAPQRGCGKRPIL